MFVNIYKIIMKESIICPSNLQFQKRQNLKDTTLKGMATKSLRTIALAYKDIEFDEFKSQLKIIEESADEGDEQRGQKD